MRKVCILTIFTAGVLCTASCVQPKKAAISTNPPEKYIFDRRAITVNSEPAGARVSQLNPATGNKIFLGLTPLAKAPAVVILGVTSPMDWHDVDALAGEIGRVHLYVEKAGYTPYENIINADPNKVTTVWVTLEKLH